MFPEFFFFADEKSQQLARKMVAEKITELDFAGKTEEWIKNFIEVYSTLLACHHVETRELDHTEKELVQLYPLVDTIYYKLTMTTLGTFSSF